MLFKRLVFAGFFFASLCALAGSFDDFFVAARRDDDATMARLLQRGFDPNTVDEQGNHALVLAIREGSLKVAHFLLQQPTVNVEVRNHAGESPLMMAALKGQLLVARRLIKRQADVNKPGWAPLHYAAAHADPVSVDMVQLLLTHHAYIDAESPNRTTPLMMAAQYGRPEVVQLLLQEGADPTLRNAQGLTALDFAKRAHRRDATQALTAALQARRAAGTR
ncbi:MAG: ankyrin repeat domain-containing protein [Hydrogenophaga sp.]